MVDSTKAKAQFLSSLADFGIHELHDTTHINTSNHIKTRILRKIHDYFKILTNYLYTLYKLWPTVYS